MKQKTPVMIIYARFHKLKILNYYKTTYNKKNQPIASLQKVIREKNTTAFVLYIKKHHCFRNTVKQRK